MENRNFVEIRFVDRTPIWELHREGEDKLMHDRFATEFFWEIAFQLVQYTHCVGGFALNKSEMNVKFKVLKFKVTQNLRLSSVSLFHFFHDLFFNFIIFRYFGTVVIISLVSK